MKNFKLLQSVGGSGVSRGFRDQDCKGFGLGLSYLQGLQYIEEFHLHYIFILDFFIENYQL